MDFLERLSLEIEDVQDELRSIPIDLSNAKVGDFGCGTGYTTLSLMLTLQTNECIGIDKFANELIFSNNQTIQQEIQQHYKISRDLTL